MSVQYSLAALVPYHLRQLSPVQVQHLLLFCLSILQNDSSPAKEIPFDSIIRKYLGLTKLLGETSSSFCINTLLKEALLVYDKALLSFS